MPDIIEVPVLPDESGRPPPGAVINAHLEVERWQKRTQQWQRLVVAISVPMAYRLFAGSDGQTLGVRLVLCIWLATFLSLFICARAGTRSHDRLDQMLGDGGGRRLPSRRDH